MADVKVEVVPTGEVHDIPPAPAPLCEDVVKTLAGGVLKDSEGRLVLQSRTLEAGKHYKFYPKDVPAGAQAASVPDVHFNIYSEHSHIDVYLPKTCSYSEICSKVEEEWPLFQALAYDLTNQGKAVPEEKWSGFVQGLSAIKAVHLSVMRLGQSFSKYTKMSPDQIRLVLKDYLGVRVEEGTSHVVAEVDHAFPALSLPPDNISVEGNTTLGELLDKLAVDFVQKLAAMGEVLHGNEYTNREYIGPVLVAAVIIVLAIRPNVMTMRDRLLLRAERPVVGQRAWGPIDYVILYRKFMITVGEAKKDNIEDAWAQHIVQMAGARDMLARQVEEQKREHTAGRKRRFWEVEELNHVPTDGILSNGDIWILTCFIPEKGNRPAQYIKSKFITMLLSQVDSVDTARTHVPVLRELTEDPLATYEAFLHEDEGKCQAAA